MGRSDGVQPNIEVIHDYLPGQTNIGNSHTIATHTLRNPIFTHFSTRTLYSDTCTNIKSISITHAKTVNADYSTELKSILDHPYES